MHRGASSHSPRHHSPPACSPVSPACGASGGRNPNRRSSARLGVRVTSGSPLRRSPGAGQRSQAAGSRSTVAGSRRMASPPTPCPYGAQGPVRVSIHLHQGGPHDDTSDAHNDSGARSWYRGSRMQRVRSGPASSETYECTVTLTQRIEWRRRREPRSE